MRYRVRASEAGSECNKSFSREAGPGEKVGAAT